MRGKIQWKVATYAVFLIAASVVLLPILWVLGNSLRITSEIGKYTDFNLRLFFPERITFEHYSVLFTEYPFAKYFLNTVFVAVIVTGLSLLLNSMAAFSFARINFFGKNVLFAALLITLIIPGEVMLLPSYLLIKNLGLMDNYLALILPALGGAFGIFYLRQSFLGIPKELEEAASIDGSDRLGIFFRIDLPLIRPHLVTLGLMTFMGQWDGFIWPLTVLTTPDKYLLQIGLNYLQGEHYSDWGAIFAGAMVCTLPIIIIFLFLQKYYIEGIASVGIKG